MRDEPRVIVAPNASPMTLDGTRTFIVGRREVAVIDPGSAAASHLAAIADAVRDAVAVRILLTHDHPDHSAGAPELASRLDAPLFSLGDHTLADGVLISTDAGDLVCLATPGHAADHAAFHWPAVGAIFCGDLMMGGLDTSVVAAPGGDVGAYLASLERLRSLRPRVIYPAHGPPFTEPDVALDRYVGHRLERERQVLGAIATGARGRAAIAELVYGRELDPQLRAFAEAAVEAYVSHLEATGRLPEGAAG